MTLVARLDRTERIVLLAALAATLLLVVGGWLLLVSPKRSQASDLKKQITTAQAKLAFERARPSQAGVTAAEVRQLELALPNTPAVATLVRQLDGLARGTGVTLDSVTPAPQTGGSGYRGIPLTVVVDGKFFRIARFLALVRNQVRTRAEGFRATGRLLDVQAINFVQSTTPRPNVKATLTMQAFVYGGGSAAPAAVAGASPTTTGAAG